MKTIFCSNNSLDVPLLQVPFLSPLSSKGITATDSIKDVVFYDIISPTDSSALDKNISDSDICVPPAILPSTFTHPMQTRSKTSVFKQKTLTIALHYEPPTIPLALAYFR